MAKVHGYTLVVKALQAEGVDTAFYIMGGPNYGLAMDMAKAGFKMIDVRHEQAAAMAAHGFSRASGKPGVCFGASGPGALNLLTGIATANVDCMPVIALGGSSGWSQYLQETFQEIDQVSIYKPVTKWSERCTLAKRVPELVSMAFRHALTGRPGPVFLDLPGDTLQEEVEESEVPWPTNYRTTARPLAEPALIAKAIQLLAKAERPVVITGSGILWSGAEKELNEFVDLTGIPFYTTPQGRGVIPEDHPLCMPYARSGAFREADVALVIGTRTGLIIQNLRPPRFRPDLKVIMVNIDPTAIGHNRGVDVGIPGDAKAVLQQLIAEGKSKLKDKSRLSNWIAQLSKTNAARREQQSVLENSDRVPMHPLRLLKEVREFIPRDAILAVDGHETLNFGRQALPSYYPRHRLNSTPLGCMGVGLPFAMGAKVAHPDKMVVCIHGDGSFGFNGMEIDTCVRHKINVLTVINNNSGWTAKIKDYDNPGRDLPASRYDKMAEAFGAHGEYVTEPKQIRPALERAAASGKPAVVNVISDPYARSETTRFAVYEM